MAGRRQTATKSVRLWIPWALVPAENRVDSGMETDLLHATIYSALSWLRSSQNA